MTSKGLFNGSDIACARGGRVQKLSFGMDPGDIVHLSGPNGAGKTSLLRIMCGALPPAAGKILWNGKNFLENGMAAHSERFAFLPADDRNLKPLETVMETVQFWAGLWGVSKDSCPGVLDRMDILKLKNTPVRHLSTGQKRRLSLARVFLKQAPLWLLDEPLSGLDKESYDLLIKALNIHCANGGMAAVASHYTLEPPKYGRLRRIDVGVK
jgi:heme exporter protein A